MKTVLVTGAGKGVGYALTKGLLEKGHQVIAGVYKEDKSAEGDIEALKNQYKETLITVPIDISDMDSIHEAKKVLEHSITKIDIIINNAGVLGKIGDDIHESMDFEDMERTFKVNALGMIKVTNVFMDILLKGKDKLLVNISSEAGSIENCNRTGWFGYCMSKAALNMASQIIQNSMREEGVKVLIIHPGWVQTYMRGRKDIEAELTAEYSATQIIKRIEESSQLNWDKAYFINIEGEHMAW